MRGRLIVVGVGIAVVLAAGVVLATRGGDDGQQPTKAKVAGQTLSTRSITAGDVTVKLTPIRLDSQGAVISVAFDTHTQELDLDVAKSARLTVAGIEWSGAAYSGAGPGGHHREGELRFPVGGPIEKTVRLTITGLSQPVRAEWRLAG